MTDSSIPDVPAFADALTPLERAKLGLQDELSVFEIGLLTYSGDDNRENLEKRAKLTGFLLQAIKAGRLVAYGNPDGWVVTKSYRSPLSGPVRAWVQVRESDPWDRCKPHLGTQRTINYRYSRDTHRDGDNCLIRRADYLALLETPEARGIPAPNWPDCSAPQGAAPVPDVTDPAERARLPLAERARLGCLPDALHVEQIATLDHPDHPAPRKARALSLLDACRNGEIPSVPGQQYDDAWIDDPEGLRWWWNILEIGEGGPTPVIARADYREWLTRQGRPLPAWWFPTAPSSLPAPVPRSTAIAPAATEPREPAPAESRAAAKRQIALVEAEDAALAALRKKLGREPDFEEFWHYLTERDATGTVADYTDDRIMWTGMDGRNCGTAKSTMRNRLTKAKSRNPFRP